MKQTTNDATALAAGNSDNTQPATEPKLVLVAEKLPYAMLLRLDAGLVDELATRFAKQGVKVKNQQVDLKTATKAAGKIYAVLEVRHNAMKAQNFRGANEPLTNFIKDITGEKPATHALTLKNAFGAYVLTGFIAETDYDGNSNNCLELAWKIADAVKGNLQHDVVKKAAQELKSRTDKEASNLREILASVKPEASLTAKEALEMLQAICDDGHLGVCLAQLPDIYEEMEEKQQHANYLAYARTLEKIDVVLGEKVDAWTREVSNAIQILAAGKPVGVYTPPETPAPATEPAAVIEGEDEAAPVVETEAVAA